MNTTELTKNQKANLDAVKAAPGGKILPVAAAKPLLSAGLIKHDGTSGYGRGRARYVAA